MPTGGFLRTNFRRTGGSTMLAIGGGVLAGSWGAGAAVAGQQVNYAQNFGFVCGSFVGQAGCIAAGAAAICSDLDPYAAMTSYYGTIYTSGYRIYPFALQALSMGGSFCAAATFPAGWVAFNVSYTTSQQSCPYIYALATNTGAINSTWTAHFVWAGFVISTP